MDADHSPRCRWAALALILTVTALRFLYLAFYCPLDLRRTKRTTGIGRGSWIGAITAKGRWSLG